jgi:hypothetical protein
MRSMVEGAGPRAVLGLAPSTAFGGPPPPLRGGGTYSPLDSVTLLR